MPGAMGAWRENSMRRRTFGRGERQGLGVSELCGLSAGRWPLGQARLDWLPLQKLFLLPIKKMKVGL